MGAHSGCPQRQADAPLNLECPGATFAGRLARRSGGDRRADRAQHALGVLVLEPAVRVEPRAERLEAVPLGIAGSEGGGGLEVALAPVGASLVVVHDRLDRAEVRL